MRATVIICTFNRSNSLRNTLRSLEKLILPDDWLWELLIVDNNSCDDTREVVEDFCSESKLNIRYVFEKRQGLSNARNRGIKESKGNIIAFSDDDMEFEPNWLFQLITTFDKFDCICVAGKIIPKWPRKKPPWFIEKGPYAMAAFDGRFDLGNKAQEISIAPFGGNMAYRKTAFDQYGVFRSDLGRSGKSLMANEETELCRRLLEAGEKIVYSPKAIVHHFLDSMHETKSYYLTRTFNHGKSYARMRRVPDRITRHLRTLIKRILRLLSNVIRWLFTIDTHIRFYYKLKVYRVLGELVESFNIIRNSAG